MRELGCLDHPAFKLTALFDATAMITCEARGYGVLDVKPLGVVWGLYPQFSAANTLMLDDLSRNFLMNPQSGLKIRPCALLALQATTRTHRQDQLSQDQRAAPSDAPFLTRAALPYQAAT